MRPTTSFFFLPHLLSLGKDIVHDFSYEITLTSLSLSHGKSSIALICDELEDPQQNHWGSHLLGIKTHKSKYHLQKLGANHLFTVPPPPTPLSLHPLHQTGSSELFILSCNFRNDCLLRWRWLFYLLDLSRINRRNGKGPTFLWACCILSSYAKSSSADTSCADDEYLDKPLVLGYNGLDEVRMNMNFRNQT